MTRLNHASEYPCEVAIIGGGPAGLMAADKISAAGYQVAVFDAMPSVGRKFLLAGVGGMNITHAEPFKQFVTRYRESQETLTPILADFNAEALRAWLHDLGVETFVGSSNRVFPKEMKAAPLLRLWLQRLRKQGVTFYPRHRLTAISANNELTITHDEQTFTLSPKVTVLALGGGSWSRLGSDGAWVEPLRTLGAKVRDLRPANCGFTANFSAYLAQKYGGNALSTVALSIAEEPSIKPLRGECIVTEYGLEGSAIYALSARLREHLERDGKVTLEIDLTPELSLDELVKRLTKPRGSNSLSNFLRKQLHLSPIKIALINEFSSAAIKASPKLLAQLIKALAIPLNATQPLDDAISSAGGVSFESLSEQLALTSQPAIFIAGEMLDWEAPTGGYLLTACFATGVRAASGAVEYLAKC